MTFSITLIAYLIDRFVGEFRFVRHPVVLMGDFIKLFEKLFYKDSVFRGIILTLSLITLVFLVSFTIQNFLSESVNYYLGVIVSGLIASTTIASKMLYDSVNDIIETLKTSNTL